LARAHSGPIEGGRAPSGARSSNKAKSSANSFPSFDVTMELRRADATNRQKSFLFNAAEQTNFAARAARKIDATPRK